MNDPPDALTKYVDWLETTATRLEQEASEEEAMATGQSISGSLKGRFRYSAMDRVDEKRRRATEYRHKAMTLQIEEKKRRRAASPRHHQ